ncbi:uncharacterized protein PGTG_00440 [Puccinia graminis f. sp. tritici CRL 75-36-700-3]|uniref:Integrase core domain-containing protein n=1 Tax=Puccinia graminis f. sp. tritici (strain CRL 75-36-700-3 / race SCCL) TaxID=418459 RepID=E3JQH2_PUCGT|nr:uncharacterized protein PGTG_00440 [Puccinia graminis f. sp. tritici CRL 75-36-700-3]EFP74484.2 hypothetical protein PGTG_00440 [Puccinia graminis f. sp. tritici CRL 75-36-700-3]
MEDITTSDVTETSGDDDTLDPDSDLEKNSIPSTPPSEDDLKALLETLFLEGFKGPKVLEILEIQHGIKWSTRTLTCHREKWGLRQCNLPQLITPLNINPAVRASIISSHSKGLNTREIQARLAKETDVHVEIRTVKRYLQKLNLKLLVNDVESGKVSLDQVYEAVDHAQRFLLHNNAGYRRMRTILARQYSINIPRQLVYDVLRDVDPEGMAARLRQTCKRRVFQTYGPNHIWSCDGHDKLKRFGITVYGFIDAWSRKVLGMFVHITNNDPRHIGVYFLHLASRLGGIPLKVTTDFGSETVEMATWQMYLSYHHGIKDGRQLTVEEASNRMHFTKSTRNQRIESLWSQMMKQHNRSIIDNILTQIENGLYDPDDQVQIVNIWVDLQNHSRKRRDHSISTPTACTPDFSYSTPEAFGSTDQLVPIPSEHIQSPLHHEYPNIDRMFTHTPGWFHEVATGIMAAFQINFEDITIGNVWFFFSRMLPSIQHHFSQHGLPTFSLETFEEDQDTPDGSEQEEDTATP